MVILKPFGFGLQKYQIWAIWYASMLFSGAEYNDLSQNDEDATGWKYRLLYLLFRIKTGALYKI